MDPRTCRAIIHLHARLGTAVVVLVELWLGAHLFRALTSTQISWSEAAFIITTTATMVMLLIVWSQISSTRERQRYYRVLRKQKGVL